ncbi:hypothetical protein MKW94_001825 [Papaver nudicaule]|uniref:Glutamyl-tRNA reductase n=1 Tax=Papaver nudicaule TaxID=74823 RepID=A0AA41W129_PAPNU|nr:hypothetical protein [Papaver nudicaule]
MAAASGFSTYVAGVKSMESLVFKTHSSVFSQFRPPIAFGGGRNNQRNVKIGVSLIPRCNAASAESSDPENKNDVRAASESGLEMLQNSGGGRYSKENSSIVVVGLSFHTAPVEMREKLAMPEAEWPRAVGELCGLHHIEEAAVLSTCNRMEIYVVALSWHRGVREVTEWMTKASGIPASELRQHLFVLRRKDAIQHLFEVSAGLDSLVLGEGQIQSQVKQVEKVCQGVPGFGRNMGDLFRCAIKVGKRVRTEIASGSVSVSSAAVELALMKLPASSLPTTRVLVIGAGNMGKLVIKHLVSKGCTQMVVVNRSEERVALIREEIDNVDIICKPLTDMFTCASEADVIFTCTASETPLFKKEHVEGLSPVSPDVGGSRLFIDISVPRNVGSCVLEVDNAKVYNVDDLKEVVAANKEDRRRKAMEAQVIISEESAKFEATRYLEPVETVKKLRAHVERIRVPELEKCLSEIEKCLAKMGHDVPEKIRRAVENLSCGMMNKILHCPVKRLRKDESDGRTHDEILENIRVINRMFSLETDTSILEQKIRAKKKKSQK